MAPLWAERSRPRTATRFRRLAKDDECLPGTAVGLHVVAHATLGLAVPQMFVFAGFIREAFGFDIAQADETREIDAPPFRLTMIRGRFDQVAVLVALTQRGYVPVAPGSPILTVRPDYEEGDLTAHPFESSATNVVTFLADGTLVFAPARSIVEAVLEVQAGQVDSLVDRPDVAALLRHLPPDVASAVIVGGHQLASATAATTDGASMPPVVLALLGNTVGGPISPNPRTGTPAPIRSDAPTSRQIMILLMRSMEAATQAVTVVDTRLITGASITDGTSFREFFSSWSVRAVPKEPIVLIDMSTTHHRGILFQMLYRRDLGFVAW